MDQDFAGSARVWLAEDPDPETRDELTLILDRGDEEALADRFGARLEFGTAGLRGELGAGPNRMNRAVVRRATAGLAAYVRARGAGTGRTAAGSDPTRAGPGGTETPGESTAGGAGRTAAPEPGSRKVPGGDRAAASNDRTRPPGESRVVVGYDARHKSDVFARDAASVLAGAGLSAYVLPRPLPTPVLAFAVRHLGAEAGVMITASHNPPRDNGYKVYRAGGSLIAPPVDAAISTEIERVGPLASVPLAETWSTLGEEVVDAYLAAVGGLPLGGARDVSVAYTPLHGVGRDVLFSAFERAGFRTPVVVREQGDPDPDFPTVSFPNPEEPGAMDLALAAGSGTDLVLANDPDADRCAVAEGGLMLTGDQVGCLLAEHVLAHTSASDRVVATTIVSSSLLAKIATDYGVGYAETLTGFKWLMQVPGRLVFAYEEALGYGVGGDHGLPVRDKDGIGAALTVTAVAARAKARGATLHDLLDDQARRYGVHASGQQSVRVADLDEIATAMERLRAGPPAAIGGRAVTSAEDLAAGGGDLPPTEGMRYRLEGDAWVIVRPSGTEPKLKAYAEVVEPVSGSVAAARRRADEELSMLRGAIPALTGVSGA